MILLMILQGETFQRTRSLSAPWLWAHTSFKTTTRTASSNHDGPAITPRAEWPLVETLQTASGLLSLAAEWRLSSLAVRSLLFEEEIATELSQLGCTENLPAFFVEEQCSGGQKHENIGYDPPCIASGNCVQSSASTPVSETNTFCCLHF